MILHYKDYEGSVEYDCEDGVYHGKVLNTPHLIIYSGTGWEGLVINFMAAVDDFETD